MTGTELKNYLISSDCFKVGKLVSFLVETDGSVVINNRLETNFICTEIKLFNIQLNYQSVMLKTEIFVNFWFGNCLSGTYNLKELDFKTLVHEMNKILKSNAIFNQWVKIENREYLINHLIN